MASAVASSAISTTFFSAAAAAASSSSSSSSFAAKPLNVVGLPTLRRNLKVSCSSARDHPRDGVSSSSSSSSTSASSSGALSGLMASSSWLLFAAASQQPAMALVDERLSTEGTGLSLGLSNPLLIWILLGVATLVWALYFTYSSSLPEGDDDSGLAL